MTTPHREEDPPVLVEIHDARMDRGPQVYLGGDIVLPLVRVSTYHPLGHDRYALHSRKAQLSFKGCAEFRVLGIINIEDTILDGHLFDGDDEVDLTDCLHGHVATQAFFIFDSGSKITMQTTQVRLDLFESQRRLRDWVGPLVSTGRTS
jgi:hypothetical protein